MRFRPFGYCALLCAALASPLSMADLTAPIDAQFAAASAPNDSERAMVDFFSLLEGRWVGRGTFYQTKTDGRQERTDYGIRIGLEYRRDQEWKATIDVRTDSGRSERNEITFTVRGSLLFVTEKGYSEPVGIIENESGRLSYRVRRSNPYNGLVYEYTYRMSVDDDGRLRAHNTIDLNGAVLVDDGFTAARR